MDLKNNQPPQDGNEPTQKSQSAVDLAQAVMQAFGGKTEGDVLKAVWQQAMEGKRNGWLTNDDLDDFYAAVSPMLDGVKRRYLSQVITQLKEL